jgi:probable rRNA maturation factor
MKVKLKKINIQNIHPELKVKKKLIQLLVEDILTSEKTNLSVDVIFVDDEFMRQLNKKFTKRERTTDVLSFGMRESKSDTIEYPGLGDIYVSLDQAKRQAEEYGVGFEEEVERLVTHGLLHLLGYDHKGKDKENIMRKKEERYLKKMAKLLESG